jgi:hypothetical protein
MRLFPLLMAERNPLPSIKVGNPFKHLQVLFLVNLFINNKPFSLSIMMQGWFNEQLAKQASSSVARAVAAGKTRIEVQFPPVPNVEEVRFGTPLNKK